MKKSLTIKLSEGEVSVLNQIIVDLLKVSLAVGSLPKNISEMEKELLSFAQSVSDCVHSNGLCDDTTSPHANVIEF